MVARKRKKDKGPIHRRTNMWGCNNGEFQSIINGRTVKWSGTIARDVLYFLEFEHERVLQYTEQPFTLEALLGSKKRIRYTPDYLVSYVDGTMLLVECKPASRLTRPHTLRQIAVGRAWAQSTGNSFAVITDQKLRCGPRLDNLRLLFRYARLPISPELKALCASYLRLYPAGVGFLNLAAYIKSLHTDTDTEILTPTIDAYSTSATGGVQAWEYEPAEPYHLAFSPIVYSLLFLHVVLADLDQSLTPRSQIYPNPACNL